MIEETKTRTIAQIAEELEIACSQLVGQIHGEVPQYSDSQIADLMEKYEVAVARERDCICGSGEP